MKTRLRAGPVLAGLGLAVTLLAGCSPPAPQAWQVVHTFGSAAGETDVYDMSALSAADVWATGYNCSAACSEHGGGTVSVLMQHWDGRSWQAMPAPAGLADDTAGESVSALSADDAWVVAVGQQRPGQSAAFVPYALRWKHGRWTAYRFATGVWLNQVLAFSDNDVWVFGAIYSGNSRVRSVSVNYHFNGRRWQRFSLPILADDAAATGPDDIWSAGQAVTGTSTARDTNALAVHWNGRNWQASRLPAVGPLTGGPTLVDSIVVAGPGDVWTAFASMSHGGCCYVRGLLHLAGGKWHQVGLPDFGSIYTPAARMSQDGRGGIWLERPGLLARQSDWLGHYSDGRWARASLGTGRGASVTLNGALAWIPGTDQVWVTGLLRARHAPAGASQVALLQLR